MVNNINLYKNLALFYKNTTLSTVIIDKLLDTILILFKRDVI